MFPMMPNSVCSNHEKAKNTFFSFTKVAQWSQMLLLFLADVQVLMSIVSFKKLITEKSIHPSVYHLRVIG